MNLESVLSIWNGNILLVRRARTAFLLNPNLDTFVAYVSALFTFRSLPWYAKRLRLLMTNPQGQNLVRQILRAHPATKSDQITLADRCDVLCAALEWLSRRLRYLRPRAEKVCEHGISYAIDLMHDPAHAHTYCFLQLRYALLLIARGETSEAGEVANVVFWFVYQMDQRIGDPNQRARVYTLFGRVLRKLQVHGDTADSFMAEATRIPGIGLFTWAKSYAAYYGVGD